MERTNVVSRPMGDAIWTMEMENAKKNPEAFGRIKNESGILFSEIIDMAFLDAVGSNMECSEFAYCENFII